METQTIRYNLRERGRKFRGQQRNFNIPKMVKLINGGAVQERVRMRDMHGYLEHLPRIKFGMNPGACQIDGAKLITIEPAIVTTYLHADDDGNIEHRAEFLDTPPGQVAERMFKNKVGGFSSAIDEGMPEFYGFDYVSEPNFALNRGYAVALDAVKTAAVTMDDVQQYNDHVQGMLRLLDSVNTAHQSEIRTAHSSLEAALATVARLEQENTEFLSMLASGRLSLDSAALEHVRPFVASNEPAARLRREIEGFRSAPLAAYAPLPDASNGDARIGKDIETVRQYFGRG